MNLRYKKLKSKPSLIKSATGLNEKDFEYLAPVFKEEWDIYISKYTFEGQTRKRKRTVKKNSTFNCQK